MRLRIKTLAEIGEQHDRICAYLDAQGRTESSHKVTILYGCIAGRIFDMLGVKELDEECLEWITEEPLIVGNY